jgi:hypothetical protein
MSSPRRCPFPRPPRLLLGCAAVLARLAPPFLGGSTPLPSLVSAASPSWLCAAPSFLQWASLWHPWLRAPWLGRSLQPLWGCSSPGAPVAAVPRRATRGRQGGSSLPTRLLTTPRVGGAARSAGRSSSPSLHGPAPWLLGDSCGGWMPRQCGPHPLSTAGVSRGLQFCTCPCGSIAPAAWSSDGAARPSGGLATLPPAARRCGA